MDAKAKSTILDDIRAARLKMHTAEFEQSEKYKNVEKKSAELYELLRDTLTTEQKDMLDRMDEEFWNLLGLYEQHYYLCGFEDGAELKKRYFMENNL